MCKNLFFSFLKLLEERYFTENRTHDWHSVLKDITRNINDTVNRSIGMPPSKVTPDMAKLIRERLYSPSNKIEPCKLEIGDNVRIPRIKNIHSKGYTQSLRQMITYINNLSFYLRLDKFNLSNC